MTKKQNLLLQMVVSNCPKVLKSATTLISYCSDLQTVIYQFVLICGSQLCSSAETFSGLPWFHHRKGTLLFSGMVGQIRRPRNWNKNTQEIVWILNTKKKRNPSNPTHLNNDVNLVRFNEEVANFKLHGWPWKIGVGQWILQDLKKKFRRENLRLIKLNNINWMHALF